MTKANKMLAHLVKLVSNFYGSTQTIQSTKDLLFPLSGDPNSDPHSPVSCDSLTEGGIERVLRRSLTQYKGSTLIYKCCLIKSLLI